MAKKPLRARTQRRETERKLADLVRARERLVRLEPGGAPSLPLVVASASVVEPDARSRPCAQCGGSLRVEEHAAREGLRIVHAVCTRCGAPRALFYRISAPS